MGSSCLECAEHAGYEMNEDLFNLHHVENGELLDVYGYDTAADDPSPGVTAD